MHSTQIEPDIIEVHGWLSDDSISRVNALHEVGIYLMRDFMFYRESELVALPGIGKRFPAYVRDFYKRHGMGDPFLPEGSRRFPKVSQRQRGRTRGVVDALIARHKKWGPWCYWINPRLPYDKAAEFFEFCKWREAGL